MREILRNADEMYALYDDEAGGLVISVVCGGIGMYQVRIRLTEEEKERFEAVGEDFLTSLARKIAYDDASYSDRKLGAEGSDD